MGISAEAVTDCGEYRCEPMRRFQVLEAADEAPFDNLVNLVQQVLPGATGAISIVDRDQCWFMAGRAVGICRTARDFFFYTHAVQRAEPFVVPDVAALPPFSEYSSGQDGSHIRGYAGVPLTAPGGRQVGTLSAIDMAPRVFFDSEVDILRSVARVVVDELELRQIASRDLLTGALSRRAWLDRAASEVARARRHRRPLSLAILDIDRFKAINDTYGHPSGDKVIKKMASLCLSTKRHSDIFGRFGGEEFVLLLPESDAGDALAVAERIRTRFADTPHDLGAPAFATVSVGVAALDPDAAGLESLIEQADLALYAAKNAGRNLCRLADGARCAPVGQ